MKTPSHLDSDLIVVIGDVHHLLDLASEGLEKIEQEQSRKIAQVFSVGDLGLFLDAEDWGYLTGPKEYRNPEHSPKIRKVWERWHWPLTAIAGNHEPFNRLRNWNPAHFDNRLNYVHAGELAHGLSQLRVYGLSGIYHPDCLDFLNPTDFRSLGKLRPADWSSLFDVVAGGHLGIKRLCYYKEQELDLLKSLPAKPHMLLTHDWPTAPDFIKFRYNRRPEIELLEVLQPQFHFSGHHHTYAASEISGTQFRGLNIITNKASYNKHTILPGWAYLLEWDGERLKDLGPWPAVG